MKQIPENFRKHRIWRPFERQKSGPGKYAALFTLLYRLRIEGLGRKHRAAEPIAVNQQARRRYQPSLRQTWDKPLWVYPTSAAV